MTPAARGPLRKGGGDELVFLPLGGAGEIGMNLYLYGYGQPQARQWIVVDLGITFADLRDPGIDVIMPDISFLEEERASLLGIVLTHAHEDHFGAVAYLWPRLRIPVHATAFTAALLRGKLEEFGLEGEVPVREIAMGSRFELGPFDIQLIDMAHSIPEANALAIRTPIANVLHSGDWKLDAGPVIPPKTDEAALRAFGDEGCRALVCDSTNILREGTSPSETEIGENLVDIVAGAKGRVAVTTFASNAGRLLSVGRAARASGRSLVVAGRAMRRILEVARETGYLSEMPEIVEEGAFAELPREKVVCLCTGSQGEPRSALSRIAAGNHPNIALEAGDLVIYSSRTIPGNEKAVGEVQNNLAALGVAVVADGEAPVHVTGHPRRGEVARMYEWLRPEILIPMHGEMRHLSEHARFARERGVPRTILARNGDIVRIAPGAAAIVDEARSGRLHLDGGLLLDALDGPVRQRRRLAFTGALSLTLVLDDKGRSRASPALAMFGLPEEGASGARLEHVVLDTIDDVLDSLPRKRRGDDAALGEAVRRAVVREIELAWGKRPLCQVSVVHV